MKNMPAPAAPRWFVDDDESLLLSLAQHVLCKYSVADVRTCADPCEALDHMADAPADIELLVTDLNMPRMNGLELARQFHELAPHAKVLLITGSAMTLPDRRTLESHGVDFLLPKPFGAYDLMRAVRHLCGTESLKSFPGD